MEFPTHELAEAEVARLREELKKTDAVHIAARNILAELRVHAGDIRYRGDTQKGIEQAITVLDTRMPDHKEEL